MPAPTRPSMRPSSMNGTRMNQLVAPTSFMTATSRRRAKMASWMVFTTRAMAPSMTPPATIKATVLRVEKWAKGVLDDLPRVADVVHARLVVVTRWPAAVMFCAFAGTTGTRAAWRPLFMTLTRSGSPLNMPLNSVYAWVLSTIAAILDLDRHHAVKLVADGGDLLGAGRRLHEDGHLRPRPATGPWPC